MVPIACRGATVLPPKELIFSNAASMSSTSTVTTGDVRSPSRRNMPPLIEPATEGMPVASVGVVLIMA